MVQFYKFTLSFSEFFSDEKVKVIVRMFRAALIAAHKCECFFFQLIQIKQISWSPEDEN